MFITDVGETEVQPYGTHGACLLIFGRLGLVVRSPADCDTIIKAAVAAKLSMPVDYRLSLTGFTALAGNPDGAP